VIVFRIITRAVRIDAAPVKFSLGFFWGKIATYISLVFNGWYTRIVTVIELQCERLLNCFLFEFCQCEKLKEKYLLTVAGSARSVMLNVIFDADDEVTLSGLTAPRYLVNSSAVCQVKYLSLNSGVGTQIFRQQSISSNFIVI
jgi:hypothetical protein